MTTVVDLLFQLILIGLHNFSRLVFKKQIEEEVMVDKDIEEQKISTEIINRAVKEFIPCTRTQRQE